MMRISAALHIQRAWRRLAAIHKSKKRKLDKASSVIATLIRSFLSYHRKLYQKRVQAVHLIIDLLVSKLIRRKIRSLIIIRRYEKFIVIFSNRFRNIKCWILFRRMKILLYSRKRAISTIRRFLKLVIDSRTKSSPSVADRVESGMASKTDLFQIRSSEPIPAERFDEDEVYKAEEIQPKLYHHSSDIIEIAKILRNNARPLRNERNSDGTSNLPNRSTNGDQDFLLEFVAKYGNHNSSGCLLEEAAKASRTNAKKKSPEIAINEERGIFDEAYSISVNSTTQGSFERPVPPVDLVSD